MYVFVQSDERSIFSSKIFRQLFNRIAISIFPSSESIAFIHRNIIITKSGWSSIFSLFCNYLRIIFIYCTIISISYFNSVIFLEYSKGSLLRPGNTIFYFRKTFRDFVRCVFIFSGKLCCIFIKIIWRNYAVKKSIYCFLTCIIKCTITTARLQSC